MGRLHLAPGDGSCLIQALKSLRPKVDLDRLEDLEDGGTASPLEAPAWRGYPGGGITLFCSSSSGTP